MGTGGDGGGVSSVERPAAMSEYARVALDPTPKPNVYVVVNPAFPAEVSLSTEFDDRAAFLASLTNRPANAVIPMPLSFRLEYVVLSDGGAVSATKHAARILASIPAPLHITAAALRARQPREADRAPLPLP